MSLITDGLRLFRRTLPSAVSGPIAERLGRRYDMRWQMARYRAQLAEIPVSRSTAVWGFLKSEIGIGEAARRAVRALQAVGQKCRAYHVPLRDRETVAFATDAPIVRSAVNVMFINANDMLKPQYSVPDFALHGAYCIGAWAWELPKFPSEWVHAADSLDQIWVASEYVRSSLESHLRDRVHVVPHPVPDRELLSTEMARRTAGLPVDTFIFLTAFDFASSYARKNPLAVVDAFETAFPQDSMSSPMLVVKCHGAEANREAARALRRRVATNKRIRIVDRVVSPDHVAALQDACDCFVSLHRAEGFGLNIAECMLAAKPVIATGFSGNMQFMTGENSYPIDYSLVPVREGEYPHGEGQVWASPVSHHAIDAMRAVSDKPSEAQRRGQAGRRTMLDEYSLSVIGHLMQWRSSDSGESEPRVTSSTRRTE